MDTQTAIRILEEARTWIGTPYHHRGMAKGAGVDCGSFLYMLFSAAGLEMQPFPSDYPPDWCLHRDDERYLDFIKPYTIEVSQAEVAGIVVFRYGRAYSHGGLITADRTVIHAWGRTEFGQVMESDWAYFTDYGNEVRPRKYFRVNL